MTTAILNPSILFHAIRYGCHSIVKFRQEINAINVFPVADGDTGDNMAATALAILHHAKEHPTIEGTLKSIRDASILGARGNSGMIFSQFFNGLIHEDFIDQAITTPIFAGMIQASGRSVRHAIANPVEGTILTLMEVWGQLLEEYSRSMPSFVELFNALTPMLSNTLSNTTYQLAILESAHVVDAGAMGFYQFIDGMRTYLEHPDQALPVEAHVCLEPAHTPAPSDLPPECRYCTEALIRGDNLSLDAITEKLSTFGDSVVITGHDRLCRFHVHTNHPEAVFTYIRTQGLIEQPKVDDMLQQFNLWHQKKESIALVTDSSADIPEKYTDAGPIYIVPLNLHIEGHHLPDKFGIAPDQFYKELPHYVTHPKTSFPAPETIRIKLQAISQHYNNVLVITLAKCLSGTHDAFVKAAEPFENTQVIDSCTTAAAQGLLVCRASELIKKGILFHDLINEVNKVKKRIKLYIIVNQFDGLVRSGRVSRIKGQVARFTGLKPILSLDEEGNVVLRDRAFSEAKAIHKLIQLMLTAQKNQGIEDYVVIHSGVAEKAENFAKMLEEALGIAPKYIMPVATVIGIHSGHNCLAVALIEGESKHGTD